jgi:hypothetical protein
MHTKNNRLLRLEKLQARRLMAADLSGGELHVVGTENSDHIEISQETRTTVALVFGRPRLVRREMIEVKISDANDRVIENRLFDASLVDRVFAEGRRGDDTIINDTDLPSVLYGNDGNDVLRGGSSQDYLRGGNHHDSLYGRAGVDFLLGDGGNDGLFGGEDLDFLYGGSGANRFLMETNQSDRRYHFGSDDAVIYFRDGGFTNNETFGIWAGASWTDEEIEVVDGALSLMHQAAGNTLLLETAYGGSMTFVRQGAPMFQSSMVGGWNDQGVITLTNNTFDNPYFRTESQDQLYVQQNVLHEVAHNWDSPSENFTVGSFRAISGWYTINGVWVINDDSEFISDYSRTDAIEDFAEHFAAYMQGDAFQYALPGVTTPQKNAYMEWFVDNIEIVSMMAR